MSGLWSRSSSVARSAFEMSSGCVKGVGTGMVRGNRDDRSVIRDEDDALADPLASSAAAAAEAFAAALVAAVFRGGMMVGKRTE